MKALLAWLVLAAAAVADVQVTICVIEMPREQAVEIAESKASGDELFKRSRELVKTGVARLFETSVVRGSSGESATSEAILEHISRTEYNPLGWVPPKPPLKLPQIRFPDVPTSFETRNLGTSVEIESTAGNRVIDLRARWEFVFHGGDSTVEDWTDSLGNRHQRKYPTYVTFKREINHTFVSGKWLFISAQSSSDAAGKIDPAKHLVIFARADDLHPQK